MYLFRAWDSPAKAASRFFSDWVPAYLFICVSSLSEWLSSVSSLQGISSSSRRAASRGKSAPGGSSASCRSRLWVLPLWGSM